MLRHSSLSITKKYVHATPEMHSKAAKKLEDFKGIENSHKSSIKSQLSS